MKHSELLREAKKHLWDGRSSYGFIIPMEPYICTAIRKASSSPNILSIANDIEARISYRLEKCATVRQWLFENFESARDASSADFQTYRLAWMEHLAKEYELEGK